MIKKIMFLSDTHNRHNYGPLNKLIREFRPDLLIHTGDFTMRGGIMETNMFMTWFASQPARYKVCIAGNHDMLFDKEHTGSAYFKTDQDPIALHIPEDVIYLQDSGVELEGIKIWGSPVQPYLHNWGFNRIGDAIKPHWDLIPDDTHILLTHGPAFEYLDTTYHGERVGCPYLTQTIFERLKDLKIHACGHIHPDYGVKTAFDGKFFVNACFLDGRYYICYKPITVTLDDEGKIEDYDLGRIELVSVKPKDEPARNLDELEVEFMIEAKNELLEDLKYNENVIGASLERNIINIYIKEVDETGLIPSTYQGFIVHTEIKTPE